MSTPEQRAENVQQQRARWKRMAQGEYGTRGNAREMRRAVLSLLAEVAALTGSLATEERVNTSALSALNVEATAGEDALRAEVERLEKELAKEREASVAAIEAAIDCDYQPGTEIGEACRQGKAIAKTDAIAAIRARAGQPTRPPMPRIVCLCGSTRFYVTFQEAYFRETMAGRIVLSVGFYSGSQQQAHGQNVGITEAQKLELDALHKEKVRLADEVLVLDVGGYVGESTRSEITFAEQLGKPIRYLSKESSPPAPPESAAGAEKSRFRPAELAAYRLGLAESSVAVAGCRLPQPITVSILAALKALAEGAR